MLYRLQNFARLFVRFRALHLLRGQSRLIYYFLVYKSQLQLTELQRENKWVANVKVRVYILKKIENPLSSADQYDYKLSENKQFHYYSFNFKLKYL